MKRTLAAVSLSLLALLTGCAGSEADGTGDSYGTNTQDDMPGTTPSSSASPTP